MGSLKEKLYQKLGFESLRVLRWFRKPYLFYLVLNISHPQYLFNLIPFRRTLYSTRKALNIPLLTAIQNFFKNWVFPSIIIEWNKLDTGLRKDEYLSVFIANIVKFIRLPPNSVYSRHNAKGLKFITRIRLVLSHLNKHKFKL